VPASLDDLLAPDLLDGLTGRTLDDVRALRDDAQRVEGGLSFVRRMVHGRLDIVGAELTRRREGGDPADLSDLIGQLPDLLADPDHSPGASPPRSPRLLEVEAVPDELAAELDQIVDTDVLADLRSLDDAALAALTQELVEFERWVSERRRTVQDRLDGLQAEIARRYRDGEATVDGLLA
jgi:hypothetical protein